MWARARASDTRWRVLGELISYLCISAVVLLPVLVTPVIADDLFNPLAQLDEAGPGLGAAVAFGWDGATGGASISMSTFFGATKYIVLIGCAAALSWCWTSMAALARRAVRFREALTFTSLALFSTLQIHAQWSNDPVADYPLAGYLAATLGFCVLAAAARVVDDPSPRTTAIATSLAVASVLYYEINIGAVLGAALLLAWNLWRRGVRRSIRGWSGVAAITIPGLPALLILYGRTLTSDQAGTYAGTTVRLSGAAKTFARGVVTSMPGSTWRLAIDTLGGRLSVVMFVFGPVLVVGWMAHFWLAPWRGAASGQAGEAPEPAVDFDHEAAIAAARNPMRTPWVSGASVAAVTIYCSFALLLQSITVKVQDEAPRIGYVYTWYAMTSGGVALGIAIGLRSVARRRDRPQLRFGVLMLGLSFLFVQNTVNWRLSEQLTTSYASNRRLLDAFDADVDVTDRCGALMRWEQTQWPEYYRIGVEEGLQEAFRYYFDEEFCPFIGETDD